MCLFPCLMSTQGIHSMINLRMSISPSTTRPRADTKPQRLVTSRLWLYMVTHNTSPLQWLHWKWWNKHDLLSPPPVATWLARSQKNCPMSLAYLFWAVGRYWVFHYSYFWCHWCLKTSWSKILCCKTPNSKKFCLWNGCLNVAWWKIPAENIRQICHYCRNDYHFEVGLMSRSVSTVCWSLEIPCAACCLCYIDGTSPEQIPPRHSQPGCSL